MGIITDSSWEEYWDEYWNNLSTTATAREKEKCDSYVNCPSSSDCTEEDWICKETGPCCKKKCECGAEKVGSLIHSEYCPLYKE